MTSTYRDIQRLTGLSLATISKYFNGGQLRPANRQAIEAAVAQLEFKVNEFARSLRTHRSRTVGVLVPEYNAFDSALLAGIEQRLRRHGYGVIVSSRGDVEDATEPVEFLESKMVDGIIAIAMPSDGPPLAAAQAHGIPVVLVDQIVAGIEADCVVVDNRGGGLAAARTLAAAGHRNVAILCGELGHYTMSKRLDGFRDGLSENEIDLPRKNVLTGPLTVRTGAEEMRAILTRDISPTAVFCTNYDLTIGALIAVNELDKRIPEDISFIGFDLIELARVVRPAMTIVAQPLADIAAHAATLIHDRVEQVRAGPPETTVLDVELHQGDSVAAPGR